MVINVFIFVFLKELIQEQAASLYPLYLLVSASSHTVITSESLLLRPSGVLDLFHPRGSFGSVILVCLVSSHVSILIPSLLMTSGSPKGLAPLV